MCGRKGKDKSQITKNRHATLTLQGGLSSRHDSRFLLVPFPSAMGKCVSNKFLLFLALCFFAAFLCAPAKTQQLLILSGQVFGLSEGRPLPSGVGGVSS